MPLSAVMRYRRTKQATLFHLSAGRGKPHRRELKGYALSQGGAGVSPIGANLRATPFPRGCRGLPCRGLGCPQIPLLFNFSLAACGGKREIEEVFKGQCPLKTLT